MQPITRPRNITRPDGAGSVCAELTVASAQDDPALSTHLTLRSRVIDRIPTPDGTAPSRRPNARMRQHPPPTSPPPVSSSSSPYLRGSVSPKKKFATQGSLFWETKTDKRAIGTEKNTKKNPIFLMVSWRATPGSGKIRPFSCGKTYRGAFRDLFF